MPYSEIINKIAEDHKIKITQIVDGDAYCIANGIDNYINQSWCCFDEIWLGIFDDEECHFLSFFHEMGHILDKSAWHLDEKATKFDIEKAAWDVGFKLANKYGVSFSDKAIKWGQKQLETYSKYKKNENNHTR